MAGNKLAQLLGLSLVLVAVVAPAMANEHGDETVCAYRPWPGAVTLAPLAGKTYANVTEVALPNVHTLRNDFDFYNGIVTPDPPYYSDNVRFARSGKLLVQWKERRHPVRAAEAVIAITGTGGLADSWFVDSGMSKQHGADYLNFSGSVINQAGFDVYAPYVTHAHNFMNARRRLANKEGQGFLDLDARRVALLFSTIKSQGYRRIHLAGLSYGGQLAVMAGRRLVPSRQLGMILAVEGWWDMSWFGRDPSGAELFAAHWEMSFDRSQTRADFYNLPPNSYLARGPCNARMFSVYDALPPKQVINYQGAHEFLMSVFNEALERYRGAGVQQRRIKAR